MRRSWSCCSMVVVPVGAEIKSTEPEPHSSQAAWLFANGVNNKGARVCALHLYSL